MDSFYESLSHESQMRTARKAAGLNSEDEEGSSGTLKAVTDMAKALEKLAKANGLTFPGDNAGEDELQNFITRIHVIMRITPTPRTTRCQLLVRLY